MKGTEGEFVTTTEAAELLGVSRWTVARMVKRGELEPVRSAAAYLFRRRDVLNLARAA